MSQTWKSPFSIPVLSDSQFEAAHDAYVAKNGYILKIPGWEDVIQINMPARITAQEIKDWELNKWDKFSPSRLAELNSQKAKLKQRYLSMLGSPQPKIARARGSLLTSIDNAEDALTTFGVMMRIMARTAPLIFSRFLTGPIGWIMTGADILNLMTLVMTPQRAARPTKRITDSITQFNPFSKKARLKRFKKLARAGITKGELIEILQTTDQVFGDGICLGPLMNLPLDIFFGNVRTLMGQKVTIQLPIEKQHFWGRLAGRTMKSLTTIFTTPEIFNIAEALPILIASNLAAIAMHGIAPSLDPHDKIVEIHDMAIEAIKPTNPLVIEAIQETGHSEDEGIAWPQTGERWATCKAIYETGNETAKDHFHKFCYDRRYNWEGFMGATQAVEGILFALEAVEGAGSVEIDYISTCKTFHSLLNAGYRLPWYLNTLDPLYQAGYQQNLDDINISNLHWLEDKYKKKFPDDHITRLTAMMRRYLWQGSPDLLYLKPYHAAFDTAIPKIAKYLEDHETNGSTPTTPGFKNFLKDTFGIELPTNETTEDQTGSPTIPLPTEIP